MNIIWQSVKFSPERIVATYAKQYSNDEIKFFDTNEKNQTIREYWMLRKDVKPEITEQIPDSYSDQAFSQRKLKEKAPY